MDDEKKQILLMALYKITQIEDKLDGGDWNEIEEAREIAHQALIDYSNGEKLFLVENPIPKLID
jgi:hypothetical protein